MKLLNGFGKKYFSLSAIQAYSLATQLHSVITSTKNHINKKSLLSFENDDEEEAPPSLQENLLLCLVLNKKPCHCECFFRRRTALAITLFKFIPRCPFYNTFFAFRRTGVHPPFA
ncbi:hypothetical protein [Poseidonibacter antarcticus]|uniref:hypothetical protein n=1 Tax=Poseidonibacter antarcticus TaxID=2478538 RepID=UPI000EF449CD|nr:hypothetical protein [Poseidonibacter antarcticus]